MWENAVAIILPVWSQLILCLQSEISVWFTLQAFVVVASVPMVNLTRGARPMSVWAIVWTIRLLVSMFVILQLCLGPTLCLKMVVSLKSTFIRVSVTMGQLVFGKNISVLAVTPASVYEATT